jgi:cell division protein ZapA (FtsZ GTPase activity inhibitor)
MTAKRRVDVQIMGFSLPVRTERDDAWVHGLSSQVNRRLDELRRSSPKANPQQLAVLLALTLAEELQIERERSVGVRAEAAAVAGRALASVNDALDALDAHDDGDDDEVGSDAVVPVGRVSAEA